MQRPFENEFNPYFARYINLVPDGDVIELMDSQLKETIELFEKISEEKSLFRYAEGKWSIKEVLGHLNDSERIFSYRALWIARNDVTPLPGFEQDDYIKNSDFNSIPLEKLIEEFLYLRKSVITMFKNFKEEYSERAGTANEHKISVRAIAYIIYGHVTHHINILKERYL